MEIVEIELFFDEREIPNPLKEKNAPIILSEPTKIRTMMLIASRIKS